MGGSVASLGLQVRRQALTEVPRPIVSVVPDVSGIDRQFDYRVPNELVSRLGLGSLVKVPLAGRTVAGWVVAVDSPSGDASRELHDVLAVAGPSVEPDVVELTSWVAERWFGSRRAVLASASAPRVRQRPVTSRRGRVTAGSDGPVVRATKNALSSGGGLVVIPPLFSALAAVETVALNGPVLVVCPTHRMARLGAASLRRRGFTTAEIPDQWELARAGTDVVIGARSAVFAPCPDLSAIVVVDEHDEAMKEERSPAWDALAVACERGRRSGVPVVATSPTPSAAALVAMRDSMHAIEDSSGWPSIIVEDLSALPVKGSLLGRHLLALASPADSSIACVVGAKGGARLLACASCGVLQLCSCGTALHRDANGALTCARCQKTFGTVCVRCGRTTLKILRGGSAHFRRELAQSIGREVLEITSDTSEDWVLGRVFVGTEAVLRRVAAVDAVVFVDVDGDLAAPRTGAVRDVLARVALAARMVGRGGQIVIQTRQPGSPVLVALSGGNPARDLATWMDKDVAARRAMGLPPFGRMVRIRYSGSAEHVSLPEVAGVDVASIGDGVLARSTDEDALARFVGAVREAGGREVRISADPWRY